MLLLNQSYLAFDAYRGERFSVGWSIPIVPIATAMHARRISGMYVSDARQVNQIGDTGASVGSRDPKSFRVACLNRFTVRWRLVSISLKMTSFCFNFICHEILDK